MNSKQALNIVFAGTPEFAAEALRVLLASSHKVVAVYTQPDRPAGRGRKLRPSAVKVLAQEHGIEVRQPVSLKSPEEQQALQALSADLMVVVAYGLILPSDILSTPRLGCLNIHGSLLPRWRGAAPIQRAILAGDVESGVTIMQMDEGLDTGAMLVKRRCVIEAEDTAQTFHDKLAVLGGDALLETLDQLVAETAQPEIQNDDLACYAHKLSKAEAMLDWNKSALELDRQVRAFNPWPVAQTQAQGKIVRVWQAEVLDQSTTVEAGCVIQADKQGIDVATGSGVLRLLSVQLPGGKVKSAADLVNARSELAQPGFCFYGE